MKYTSPTTPSTPAVMFIHQMARGKMKISASCQPMLLTYYSLVAQGRDHLHFQKIEELPRHSPSCFANQTSSCKQFRFGVSKSTLNITPFFCHGGRTEIISAKWPVLEALTFDISIRRSTPVYTKFSSKESR